MKMKETILVTGAGPNGITGRLLKENLSNDYHVIAPSSKDLDLTNDEMVSKFFDVNLIDYVIHCATFRPLHNTTNHFVDDILESNLRMYFSLARQNKCYKKMIYFGSGAEFDKKYPIVNAKEVEFGRSIPNDAYGFGKYIMNGYTQESNNIYNLRLFGTINPYERYTKNVISNICVKALVSDRINLRKNCKFSFVDMDDVVDIVKLVLNNKMDFHDYNVTSDKEFYLSDLAKLIAGFSQKKVSIHFEHEGLNLEYTGDNERIRNQFSNFKFTDISKSLRKVYDYYSQNQNSIDFYNIDSRWNN